MGISPPRPSRLRWLDRLATFGLIVTALALLAGELGRFHWLLELSSHFLVQYALALAIAAAWFLLRRRWLRLGATILLLLLPAWRLAPYLPVGADGATAAAATHHIRVMTINVQASSTAYDRVRAEIERLDPDVIFLPENTDRWATGLAPLRERYPYAVDGQSPSVFSLFLFSRLPLSETAIMNLPEPGGFPAITAHICLEDTGDERSCLRLIGVHPPPPMRAGIAAARDEALRALPALIAQGDAARTVVLGDFNCTPWSPRFRDLLAASGLRDAARGASLDPTWASRRLPFGLKIDHILVGDALTVSDYAVRDDVGSDHYPVVADLELRGVSN